MIALTALSKWCAGDCKALYVGDFKDFQRIWGIAWWKHETAPYKKIEEWMEKRSKEIDELSENAVEILAASIK